MILGIDRILIRVPALDAAVRFYTSMGMKLVKQDARLASLKFHEGAAELVLHTDDDLPTDAVYYRVDDVRAMYEKRGELGVTFLSSPAPAARGWRATIKDPFGNVLLILDRAKESANQTNAVEDAKAPGTLFSGVATRVKGDPELLAKLYAKVGRTADDLPYSPEFESLYQGYIAQLGDPKPARDEVWRHLINLRKKKGGLAKLGKAKSPAPELSEEDQNRLLELLGEEIGRRDRLPYTAKFVKLVEAFNKARGKTLSPHLVWRAVATLAK